MRGRVEKKNGIKGVGVRGGWGKGKELLSVQLETRYYFLKIIKLSNTAAIITKGKAIHGSPFLSYMYMGMGLSLVAL